MSDILCSYNDREANLMAYLYDEIEPSDREAFEAHLKTCARCRVELNGLGGVREQLAEWAIGPVTSRQSIVASQSIVPSESIVASRSALVSRAPSDEPRTASREPRDASGVWTTVPAWAQAAAAVLVLGVAAGAANINIHYDAQNGLNVRSGWIQERGSQGSQGSQASRAVGSQPAVIDAVSRAELTALEQQLRNEIRAVAAVPAHTVTPPSDAETVRRVRALLDETERRHERELALKVAEVMRDVNMQRQADLRKIDQNIDQGRVEVLRNRQMLDYYMQRVSQRQ